MNGTGALPVPTPLSCEEVGDLVGLLALDALEPEEAVAVAAHLQRCPVEHATVTEAATVVAALAGLAEPLAAPATLRERVLAVVAATPQVPEMAHAPAPSPALAGAGSLADVTAGAPSVPDAPAPPPSAGSLPDATRTPLPDAAPGSESGLRRRPASFEAGRARRSPILLRRRASAPEGRTGISPPGWLWLATAAVAMLLITVLGAWNLGLQQRAVDAEERVALLNEAITAATAPSSRVVSLVGSGPAEGATGFFCLTAAREGYIVVEGLPAVPGGQAYQVWYVVDGTPVSAGLMTPDPDGLAMLSDMEPPAATREVTITIEADSGANLPTTAPVMTGDLSATPPEAGLPTTLSRGEGIL